ncbi:DMT family transporter [Shouchella shacheensis]|uniref:DMT family transporter n=1 Tax=Shouchella shacheensis TaxID=1649580 RepID=UPI0007401D7C|nr:EamA family transporter [Shouchella shacheensis]
MSKSSAYLSIALGAALWGIIGLFVTRLYELGFEPVHVVTLRVTCAAIFLVGFVFLKDKRKLVIRLADGRYFIGTGIVSILFFNWFLFQAIEMTTISVATTLLYTAPMFVLVLSRVFFKEWITKEKGVALFFTLIGCALVVGLLPTGTEAISLTGLLLGIGSGFFYALYSIFGKFALAKYEAMTVSTYTFVFAAVAIAPFSGLWHVPHLLGNGQVWLYVLGLGFFSTTLAFLLYTKGLQYVESSKASIIATIEPVVAVLVSVLLVGEALTLWQGLGVGLVLFAVVLVQKRTKIERERMSGGIKKKADA